MTIRSSGRPAEEPNVLRALLSVLRRVCGTATLILVLVPLSACNGFFVCPTCTSTGTGGTTNTGDFAYVANSSAGATYLSAYNVTSGKLSVIGSLSLGFIPVALAVSPDNEFLYVASAPGATSPGIYAFAISSTGTLTAENSGKALITDTVSSMAISPDGGWLFTVNSDGLTMSEYAVDTSTGGLTLQGTTVLPGATCILTIATPSSQSCSVTISPSGTYVVASLGAAGDAVYSFSSTSGITDTGAFTIPSGTTTANPTGDFSAALDGNNFVYIARTSSVAVYSLASTGATSVGTIAYAAGSTPRSAVLAKTYSYLYTANEGSGNISGFGINSAGALTSLSSTPFTGPANVSALGVDNSGNYLVAVGYDATAGVRLYSLPSTGLLTQVDAAASGTNTLYPALVAMTH